MKPEQVIKRLKADAARLPWLVYLVVGADERTILSTTPEKLAVERLKEIDGGAVGYAGAILIENRIEIYIRALRVEDKASQAVLQSMADKLAAMAQDFLAEAAQQLRARIEGKK
jgi:hypothetical protein